MLVSVIFRSSLRYQFSVLLCLSRHALPLPSDPSRPRRRRSDLSSSLSSSSSVRPALRPLMCIPRQDSCTQSRPESIMYALSHHLAVVIAALLCHCCYVVLIICICLTVCRSATSCRAAGFDFFWSSVCTCSLRRWVLLRVSGAHWRHSSEHCGVTSQQLRHVGVGGAGHHK